MKFENDMLYLSICAVNNIKPDIKRVEKMDLDKLFNACQSQKITALVCYALESVITPPKKWIEEKGKSVRKNLLFDIERKQIIKFMEKSGIKYMPLKGIIIKDYYPKTGMRQMSDNDIYYDESFKKQIQEYMLSIGYNCTSKDDHHDEFEKQPVYNFEMHHQLFLDDSHEKIYRYYLDIENRLIKDENNDFGYHLSDEDFYIYIIAHEYKHFANRGTGIRSLLDCIILLNRFENELDWDYIKRETDKMELTLFEETQRNLCKKISSSFPEVDFTQDEVEMLKYFISSGVYGNCNTYIVNQLTGEVGNSSRKVTFGMKVKYVFKRIFPPIQFYKSRYPFFYRHKYLIPFCFFYRIFKLLFNRNDCTNRELDNLKKLK